jgi:hypothetical protein
LCTVTVSLKELKGQTLAERLEYASGHYGDTMVGKAARALATHVRDMSRLKSDQTDAALTKLANASTCTSVYWGCGSCGVEFARVDVYCDSSGGSSPDYSYCSAC